MYPNYLNNNFNRYNPYLQNYAQYQQPFMPQQQMQQPIAQPMQYEMPITNIRYLNEKEMASYVLPFPNTKEMLIDKASGVVCVKSTDQIGQSNAKFFKFEEIPDQVENKQNKSNSEPKTDMSKYASKDDVKSLTGLITEMTDKLSKLEGKINDKQSNANANANNG